MVEGTHFLPLWQWGKPSPPGPGARTYGEVEAPWSLLSHLHRQGGWWSDVLAVGTRDLAHRNKTSWLGPVSEALFFLFTQENVQGR